MLSIEVFCLILLEPYRQSCLVNSSWSSRLRFVQLLSVVLVKEEEFYH
jgi:hypothetical protein